VNDTVTILLPSVDIGDPHLCTDSHAVLTLRRLLFQGLLAYDGVSLRNALAESWELEDQGRTWIFRLRPGSRFPGGRELVADDVVYSLRRAASPEAPGQLFTVTHHAYIGKAEIQAPDSGTVVLRNPDPIADLGELLPDLAILPAGWRSYDDGTGTGAYLLEERSAGRAVLLRREDLDGSTGRPARIELRAQPDAGARSAAVLEGRADLALDPRLEAFEAAGGRVEAAGWDTSLSVIFFVDCTAAPLSDPRVRRALNLAVDRERMISQVLGGRAKPLNGPFSDRHFGCDPRLAPYPYDPEQARSLLQEAGVGPQYLLEIHAPTALPEEGPALAAFLSEAYRAVGLETRVVLHEDRTEYARRVAAKELRGLSCFDSSPLSTYKVLHEKLDSRFSGTWWQGFHDERVNELLSQAAATINTAARRQVYWHVYRLLHDEAPWVFLYQPRRFWARRAGAGVDLRIDDLGFLEV